MQAPTTMSRKRSFSPSFPLAFARCCGVAAARRAPFCKSRISNSNASPTLSNAGQPVSRASILEQVWKFDLGAMTNVVDVYINYPRHKVDFGYDRALIRTIRGVGYQDWRKHQTRLVLERPPRST